MRHSNSVRLPVIIMSCQKGWWIELNDFGMQATDYCFIMGYESTKNNATSPRKCIIVIVVNLPSNSAELKCFVQLFTASSCQAS